MKWRNFISVSILYVCYFKIIFTRKENKFGKNFQITEFAFSSCGVPDEIRANYHKDFTVISVTIIGIDEPHSGKKLSHTISSFKWEVVYLYIQRGPSTRISSWMHHHKPLP